MTELQPSDRLSLAIANYHPHVRNTTTYRIHTHMFDNEGTLVTSWCLEDAMEDLAEQLGLDETDQFNDCVLDCMKEGLFENEAWEKTSQDDNGWIWLNGATPVSTADWSVREADKREMTIVRRLYERQRRIEEGELV